MPVSHYRSPVRSRVLKALSKGEEPSANDILVLAAGNGGYVYQDDPAITADPALAGWAARLELLELPSTPAYVLRKLLELAIRHDDGAWCVLASRRELAAVLSVSESTVRRSLRAAEKAKLITILPTQDEHGRDYKNLIRLNAPAPALTLVPAVTPIPDMPRPGRFRKALSLVRGVLA